MRSTSSKALPRFKRPSSTAAAFPIRSSLPNRTCSESRGQPSGEANPNLSRDSLPNLRPRSFPTRPLGNTELPNQQHPLPVPSRSNAPNVRNVLSLSFSLSPIPRILSFLSLLLLLLRLLFFFSNGLYFSSGRTSCLQSPRKKAQRG